MSRSNHLRAKPADQSFEIRLPVPNPAEAHALALTAAHLAHATQLSEILTSYDANKELAQRLSGEIDALLEQADAQWRAFLMRSCVSSAEYDAMDAMGPPNAISIDGDNGLPVAVWASSTPRDPSEWPPGLTLAVARHETTFIPTVPFRQVALESLPASVQKVRITDPRHTAMAALDEVFRVMAHDLDTHIRDAVPSIAWLRLAHLVAFYRKAAKLSREGLCEDEFRNWEERLDEISTPVDQMARVIAEGALTSRAQHVAALQLVARFVGRTMDMSQQSNPEANESDWLTPTLQTVDQARKSVEAAMQGYNLALMAFAGVASPGASAMAITRPVPHGLPVLAIVPEGTSVTTLRTARMLPAPAPASGSAPIASLAVTGATVPALPSSGERTAHRPRKR
ncbi:hypothetical protein [Rhodanobacter denitrificans]|uniref:hypothetical protein n=1 Tax=Rhodanobacter denitrificans TaxID=666685 RepID=UPI001F43F8C9|nr:hypothetical protein [Rhodanobacter denitrificans]UJJ60400.1 hypothetical protein LRK55_18345 [Rhodanobacter denitrificans]